MRHPLTEIEATVLRVDPREGLSHGALNCGREHVASDANDCRLTRLTSAIIVLLLVKRSGNATAKAL